MAEELWHKVAIPTILYACEITEVSPRVMKAIEGIHAQMAAFALGVSGNCSHAAILREIGWESLTCKMFKRKIKFFLRFQSMDNDRVSKKVFNDCFSQDGEMTVPWKVSYRSEMEQIPTKCNIPNLDKDSKWPHIARILEKWDTSEIDKVIKSKVFPCKKLLNRSCFSVCSK